MSQTKIRLTRTELYEKVRATPMRTLAKEFRMSDSIWTSTSGLRPEFEELTRQVVGLAKVCRKHNVPVPPVGYWRRKETAL